MMGSKSFCIIDDGKTTNWSRLMVLLHKNALVSVDLETIPGPVLAFSYWEQNASVNAPKPHGRRAAWLRGLNNAADGFSRNPYKTPGPRCDWHAGYIAGYIAGKRRTTITGRFPMQESFPALFAKRTAEEIQSSERALFLGLDYAGIENRVLAWGNSKYPAEGHL